RRQFSTAPPVDWQRRRAVPGVLGADPAVPGGAARHALLSEVSEAVTADPAQGNPVLIGSIVGRPIGPRRPIWPACSNRARHLCSGRRPARLAGAAQCAAPRLLEALLVEEIQAEQAVFIPYCNRGPVFLQRPLYPHF